MKKNFLNKILTGAFLVVVLGSCVKDLDRLPTNEVTAETVYSTPLGYRQAFAKVYGAWATTGNAGPAGNNDLQGVPDEGPFADFLRTFWYTQELTTDEAILGWNDPGLPDMHNMSWSANNPILVGLYYRSTFQITLANDFLRQSEDAKLSARGISGADADMIRQFRSEARFIRAFQYWVLMDSYGNPPFFTDADQLGSNVPNQIKRAELFNYIESELKAIEPMMVTPRTNEYGRADQAAVWALLARLYLNAEVYTGTARYTDAITYSKKVIDAGYSLIPNYRHLFLADNHQNTNEFILTINYDGLRTQGFGGTTFLTHAAVGGNMDKNLFGIPSGGWGGIRTTKNIPNLFPDVTGTVDERAQFHTDGQQLEITQVGSFTHGYAITKFRNLTRSGALAPNIDSKGDHVDIDFPLFRLPEMYLIYAEAVLRGGTGGSMATALEYVNIIRQRAYNNTSGNITQAQLTLDFIIDERARELYWEAFRRTDLIRFNRFTSSSYLWPWKGGVPNGRGVETYRRLFPLPSSDVTANPNLVQNPGY